MKSRSYHGTFNEIKSRSFTSGMRTVRFCDSVTFNRTFGLVRHMAWYGMVDVCDGYLAVWYGGRSVRVQLRIGTMSLGRHCGQVCMVWYGM